MVTFEKKQILIDGKAVFLLSGETHYYRQPRENWQHLLDEAKALGLNCIASYVPWILHEEHEGEYNFDGNLDLGAFIDLCHENGLYFFVRPGPFIMAEMKKEGIPYWVGHKHKSALPIGFDGVSVVGNTLDYLDKGYLGECKKWYERVMQVIVPRLHSNGGNIIGVQLDNEIGMLNWVTNTPVLNDNVLNQFAAWVKENGLTDRYPFMLDCSDDMMDKLRSPQEAYAQEFHFDFGRFLRKYYAEYVRCLKEYAEDCGVKDTPFFINIHGTGSGRIFDFPLGISQLYESYNQGEGMISGTDVYLGEPREGNYQDMYVINALTDCMNKKGNPLTSIEFECSDGPYCSLSGMRYDPSATSHKMLMCVSQNARMLSFYVFSGGENYLLKAPESDGNERMAFTGEMHGLNAPVQPDGTHNFSFGYISKTARTIHALNELIGKSNQEIDGVTMGFIPDYFLTEMTYAKSDKTKAVFDDLRRWRCEGSIDSIARGLVSNGIHFDAVDIQHESIPQNKLLVVLSANFMQADVQQKLCSFVTSGGRLMIYGEIPEYDLDGNVCTILRDALGLSAGEKITTAEPNYFLTIACTKQFEGVTTALRASHAQCFPMDDSAILTPYKSKMMCGFIKSIGAGKVCAVTVDYPADMDFYNRVWAELDVEPTVYAPYYRQGIYIAKTISDDGQRLIYVLNLDAMEKTVDINLDGEVLFKDFILTPKASHILPVNVKTASATVEQSTAEIVGITNDSITFLPTQKQTRIVLKAVKQVCEAPQYIASADSDSVVITATGDSEFTVNFK